MVTLASTYIFKWYRFSIYSIDILSLTHQHVISTIASCKVSNDLFFLLKLSVELKRSLMEITRHTCEKVQVSHDGDFFYEYKKREKIIEMNKKICKCCRKNANIDEKHLTAFKLIPTMAMWMRRVMMRFGDGLRDYSACINFRKNTKKSEREVGKQQCIHLSDHKTNLLIIAAVRRARRHEI